MRFSLISACTFMRVNTVYMKHISTICSQLLLVRQLGGDRCHLRGVPPGQLLRRPSTSKRFCLSAIFIQPGFYFLCLSHVFFVFASRWFIFIFIYLLYIFSLYSGFFDLCWVISLGCCPRIDRPAHTLYIYGIV